MNIGDKVRFLNDVGGGVISGFQGKDIALVTDEDGFDIPMPIRECIVINTNAYDIERPVTLPDQKDQTEKTAKTVRLHPIGEADLKITQKDSYTSDSKQPITFRPTPLERLGGENLNLLLAFVVHDKQDTGVRSYDAYIINDCNYNVHFSLFSYEGSLCRLRHEGEVNANTKMWLETFTTNQLTEWERIGLQAMFWKPNKAFQPKHPINVSLRIDGPKFFKTNSFKNNVYFDGPALLTYAVRNDKPLHNVFVKADEVLDALVTPKSGNQPVRQPARGKSVEPNSPLEVDLHADKLLDTMVGLSSADILEYQLKTFRNVMEANKKLRGQHIVFIHGKGEGVLRAAIIKELKAHYKQCHWQDASFREYGFGATMVTM